jgi:hypothetical protein
MDEKLIPGFQQSGDVNLVRNQHVAQPRHELPIHKNVGKTVNAFENKERMLALALRFGREIERVPHMATLIVAQRVDVHSKKRIGHGEASFSQINLQISGNNGWEHVHAEPF